MIPIILRFELQKRTQSTSEQSYINLLFDELPFKINTKQKR